MLQAVMVAVLTLDTLFSAAPPWGAQPTRIVWAPAGTSFLYVLSSQDPTIAQSVEQYDMRTGQSRALIAPAAYGGKPQTPASVTWSPDGNFVAFLEHGTLYVRDLATNLDRTVAADAGDFAWSAQSDAIAFTHRADIYVAHLQPKLRVEQVTSGGEPDTILNGTLDWVYPEELGTEHGFAWSPDGKSIAYMRMDERAVTRFPLTDFLPFDNDVAYQRYPLSGERNPAVSLHVVDLESHASRLIYDAGARDEYLPWFAWKPHSGDLVAELLDRAQQHLRVMTWTNAKDPAPVYRQQSNSWIDVVPPPVWLADGSSLWILDRENTKMLYRRSPNGSLQRLGGVYHVFQIYGADEHGRRAFVGAAFPTRRDRSLLAVPIDGGDATDLTPGAGSHAITVSPALNAFVDSYSTLNDPPSVQVTSIAGGTSQTPWPRASALAADMLHVDQLQVASPYGPLDAYMIEPPGFDASKKYPAITYVYGGPEAPACANTFGSMRQLYHELLAQAGYIVFCIDGPASQIDNSQHVRMLYHNFGPGSLAGQEIGAAYLRSLPFVDAARLGIWGWSFGGFETVYALTHSSSWAAGAAGAPVTDWHLYDSIYTERYMGSPQSNARAYDASSDLNAAAGLRGALLISHGTSDDNVHMANTISMLDAFAAADRTNVDFYAYARQKHGFTSLSDLRRLYSSMLAWWKAHL